jgi:3-deoxy-D-manno-octulosonic-acid transferase
MSLFLYKLTIQSYLLAIRLAAPFNTKAKLFLVGRKNIFQKIENALQAHDSKVAWFHCASLGEFEQCRPILEKFKQEFPEFKIVLTFFSPSGYEIRKNYALADYIFYLPVDTKANAQKFLDLVNPALIFFVKYEFWHFYLHEAALRNIPTLLFSAIFRADQLFFKPYGSFYRSILKAFDFIFVQNKTSLNLLLKININNISVVGDTRFDRVKDICSNPKNIEIAEKFKNGIKIMVVGSSWAEDMEVIATFANESDLKFIIAPHEISENNIVNIESLIKRKTIRYSQAESKSVELFDVLIIDNIGMLSSLYKYGEYAYIGGAFGKGLHNILEAATYGIPVFFGNKNFSKFQEAKDLLKMKGAFAVGSAEDLKKIIEGFENNEDKRILAGSICFRYIEDNLGATEKVMNYVRGILKTERWKEK